MSFIRLKKAASGAKSRPCRAALPKARRKKSAARTCLTPRADASRAILRRPSGVLPRRCVRLRRLFVAVALACRLFTHEAVDAKGGRGLSRAQWLCLSSLDGVSSHLEECFDGTFGSRPLARKSSDEARNVAFDLPCLRNHAPEAVRRSRMGKDAANSRHGGGDLVPCAHHEEDRRLFVCGGVRTAAVRQGEATRQDLKSPICT